MNAGPTWMVWLQLLGLLAGEVALVVAGAAWLQHFTGSAWWGRAIWQVCPGGLLALPVFGLSGAARGLGGWVVGRGRARVPGAGPPAGAGPGAGREFAAR